MRYLIFLSFICFVTAAQASCPMGFSFMKTMSEEQMLVSYKACAELYNDDEAQAKLAELYDKGTATFSPDIKRALFYYQLSAENGNAVSQGRLAELYIELDKDRENRAVMYEYLNSIFVNQQQEESSFHGELVHPYVLLILANEKAANKWYYPTKVKEPSPTAQTLYQNYQIDEAKKKQFMQQATAWKKRKLLDVAKEVLSAQEYQTFVNKLYPTSGHADAFQRSQALKEFQEKFQQMQ